MCIPISSYHSKGNAEDTCITIMVRSSSVWLQPYTGKNRLTMCVNVDYMQVPSAVYISLFSMASFSTFSCSLRARPYILDTCIQGPHLWTLQFFMTLVLLQ